MKIEKKYKTTGGKINLKRSNHIDMNKSNLKKLSKSELIEPLLKQNVRPTSKGWMMKNQFPHHEKVSSRWFRQDYEENIILPLPEFRDDYKPIPAPRTKTLVVEKPVPIPRTKIKQ